MPRRRAVEARLQNRHWVVRVPAISEGSGEGPADPPADGSLPRIVAAPGRGTAPVSVWEPARLLPPCRGRAGSLVLDPAATLGSVWDSPSRAHTEFRTGHVHHSPLSHLGALGRRGSCYLWTLTDSGAQRSINSAASAS